ncbi:hypothetical protein BO94DRAFT_476066 [Aspergillus sclerotioniger CBS 115572]|uniref:Zn(2)-C6 fungal-type domain-containing protein n=1 Tax=Aspergillus sclerotioniger CBS 115572 TaxID=1450535 RepID=A0A317VCU2_9EURO|nr:hypothetical protein BO94DRAFT_476066 [Aspergillus sclerotioniger CBS 115572]PWY72184.1 hypothetical protein BO94DRAFT_476066 [Aspergillus sclerotioniger CBS 115572]
MAMICGLAMIAFVVSSACAIIALILGALSWSRTASLFLPFPQWIPVITTLFPLITVLALYLANRLSSTAGADNTHPFNHWQRLFPIADHLHSIISAIIATVALAYLYPENVLTCRLEQEWQEYFRLKDAQPIRTIQDEFRCCGFRSIHDRAWPFKDRTHGDDACEVQLGYGQSCLVPWTQQQQSASWMVFAAAVLTLFMKVAFYQAMRSSWINTRFGRQAPEYQQITHPGLEDEDTDGDAEESRYGAFLPRAHPRYDTEWNERYGYLLRCLQIDLMGHTAPLKPMSASLNLSAIMSMRNPAGMCYSCSQQPTMGPRSKGLKVFSSRSRTGCRTCRARRIKCDETPGSSCTNCTSTGRTCDGYPVFQLPAKARFRPGLRPIDINLPGMTSDERRCLAFFQSHTMPMMTGLFDSELWQRIVLQMSQAEPAVGHAVAALGALHEDNEMMSGAVVKKSKDYRLFALEQYGCAIKALRQRLGSNDPQLRVTALVCCIIFIFFDFIQENYHNALMHLRNGAYILVHDTGPQARSSILTGLDTFTAETALSRTFAHLTVQAAHFDSSDSVIKLHPSDMHLAEFHYDSLELESLQDAKDKLDPMINNMVRFWPRCEAALRNHSTDYASLCLEQQTQYTNLQHHIRAFEAFLSRYRPTTAKGVRSIDTIRLYQIILTTGIGAFLELRETVYDQYQEEWKRSVDLTEKIITSFKTERADNHLPNVVSDLGVLLPLTWVGFKCRDVKIRGRVLDLFQSWPHREGPHDSMVLFYQVREAAAIEREAAGQDGYVPEYSRVRMVSFEKMEGGRQAVLLYALSDPEARELQMRRRVFTMDEK